MKRLIVCTMSAARRIAAFALRLLEPVLLAVLPPRSESAARLNYARAQRHYIRLKLATSNPQRPHGLLASLADETIRCLDMAVVGSPRLFFAHRLASSVHFMVGNAEGFLSRLVDFYAARDAYAKSRQFDRLGLRFIPPWPVMRTIGNTAVYEGLIKCRILNQDDARLMLVYDRRNAGSFVNPHLMSYWQDYMTIIDDPATCRITDPIAAALSEEDAGPFRLGDKILPTHSALALANHQWETEGRPPVFRLREEDRARGVAALQNFGFNEHDWFVCLHVREPSAKGNEPFRQAAIDDYIPAIKAVTDRGGWVVRLGIGGPPLPAMEHVLDYANSAIRSDWMDVFLCGACRFFIGTSSGMYTVSHAFGRPVVQTNYLPTSTLYLGSDHLFLPKLARNKTTGNMLSFNDLMSAPFSIAANDAVLDEILDVTVISNTAEEIREVVEEMIDQVDGRPDATGNEQDRHLQDRFKALTAAAGTLVGLPGVPLNCRIGTAFLRRHQSLLPIDTTDPTSETESQTTHA